MDVGALHVSKNAAWISQTPVSETGIPPSLIITCDVALAHVCDEVEGEYLTNFRLAIIDMEWYLLHQSLKRSTP